LALAAALALPVALALQPEQRQADVSQTSPQLRQLAYIMVTDCHTPQERTKAQGANDFLSSARWPRFVFIRRAADLAGRARPQLAGLPLVVFFED
jgi:hypothetical protein